MGGTLADKLLVHDGCWKEGLFSLGLRSPGCDSRADAHVHTDSTNWTQWVTKEEVGDDDDIKLGGKYGQGRWIYSKYIMDTHKILKE